MYRKGIKRVIDFILALGGLIILSPVFIILCLWIKLDSKGPVFFKQKRIGINKTYFNILKFRTMYIDTPKDMPTHMLANPEQYITKTGRFLRKTSLDELPQIFNIFKGDMSIVGPRPALWNQDDLVAERDKYGANDVTPGLTGWAQINGYRGETRELWQMEKRVEYDIWYIENWNILLDLKIIFLTFVLLLKGDENAV